MNEMIVLKEISKSYGDIKAVNKVSFSIKKGEIVGFLGPNGAGKSTAMKMITGFMPADEGDIFIKGKNIKENPVQSRNVIGYLPESNPLYMDMTVDEYLTFIGNMRGLESLEGAKKAAMEKCGIFSVKNRIIGTLSKGYKQRVGLAQAIIHEPEILILDEPVNGLDPKQITEIRSLIKMIGEEKTVILSSHILSEVEAVASRVVIINQGKIVSDDSIENLKLRGEGKNILKIKFLKLPQENEVINSLKNIENVISVRKIEENEFSVTAKKGDFITNKIFHIACEKKWEVSQLFVEASSLENLFLDLISGGEK